MRTGVNMSRVFFICVILLIIGDMATFAIAAIVVPNEIKQPGTQQMEIPALIPAIQDTPGPYRDKTLNKACYHCHEHDGPASIVRVWSYRY
jgi:hypothetical protein